MNRRIQIIMGCVVALILASAGLAILLGQNPNDTLVQHDLVWSVNVGETFVYNMTFVSSSGSPLEEWEVFDGAEIQVTIVSLPVLPSPMSAPSFVDEVANGLKVSTEFANGSTIQSTIRSTLESSISFLFFPVGDWDIIKEMFEHGVEVVEPAGEFSKNILYQGNYTDAAFFSFRRDQSQQASGHGSYIGKLYGDLALDTGIPHYIYDYFSFSHVAGYDYEITFSLLYMY